MSLDTKATRDLAARAMKVAADSNWSHEACAALADALAIHSGAINEEIARDAWKKVKERHG